MVWEILGRITEAREEAFVDDVPAAVCSARIVLPCAMQALESDSQQRISIESVKTYYRRCVELLELEAIFS